MKLSENLVHPTNDELKELQKFDYKEVMKGISIEKEHTKDERVAARIALDHLKENPHYYRELAKAQIEDVMSYDFFAILEADDDVDSEDIPLGMSKEAYLQKIGKTSKAPEVPSAKTAPAAPAKQEEPFHWEGHKAHEWEKAARAKGMPSLRRPKPEEIKHPWDAVDPRSEADYTSLLKRQMRMDKNTAAVKEREERISARKQDLSDRQTMLIAGKSHMTRTGKMEIRPSRVLRRTTKGANLSFLKDLSILAIKGASGARRLDKEQTDALRIEKLTPKPVKSPEDKAADAYSYRRNIFKGFSDTTLARRAKERQQPEVISGIPLSAADAPKKKEPTGAKPPKQKMTTVTKRHGAVTHTFEGTMKKNYYNSLLEAAGKYSTHYVPKEQNVAKRERSTEHLAKVAATKNARENSIKGTPPVMKAPAEVKMPSVFSRLVAGGQDFSRSPLELKRNNEPARDTGFTPAMRDANISSRIKHLASKFRKAKADDLRAERAVKQTAYVRRGGVPKDNFGVEPPKPAEAAPAEKPVPKPKSKKATTPKEGVKKKNK